MQNFLESIISRPTVI